MFEAYERRITELLNLLGMAVEALEEHKDETTLPYLLGRLGEILKSRGLTAAQKHPYSDWQYEVSNGDTRLGYEEWLEHCEEADRGEDGYERTD